jgi:hypothetical protein
MKDVTSGSAAKIPPPFAKQRLLEPPKGVIPTALGVILVSSGFSSKFGNRIVVLENMENEAVA